MTARTTWKCPNCGEQHQDAFETCWKCGSDPAGNRDPDFRVSEPLREQDQAPDSPTDDTELPSLQLPAITYFSIPPYIWISVIIAPNNLGQLDGKQMSDFYPSSIEIVLECVAFVLIHIPIFFAMIRAMFTCIIRRQKQSDSLASILWMLSMFRLPESIRRSQRWFVPVYYGSIAALFVVPLGFGAWHLIQLT